MQALTEIFPKVLTQFTVVIHQNNFMKKVCRSAIQDTVHRAKQGRKCFIVETDDNTGKWQIRRVGFLSTPANKYSTYLVIWDLQRATVTL